MKKKVEILQQKLTFVEEHKCKMVKYIPKFQFLKVIVLLNTYMQFLYLLLCNLSGKYAIICWTPLNLNTNDGIKALYAVIYHKKTYLTSILRLLDDIMHQTAMDSFKIMNFRFT